MIRGALVGVVLVVAAVLAVFQLKYRAWPWEPPHQVSWRGTDWQREDGSTKAPARMYEVTRQPPLVGTQLYSPYSAAERKRLSHGSMAEPCGGTLFAQDGDRVVAYIRPG